MKTEYAGLSDLTDDGEALTDAQALAWIESLRTLSSSKKGTVQDLVKTFVTQVLPKQSSLPVGMGNLIIHWLDEEHAHMVADWVIANPQEGLGLLDAFVRINTSESLLQLQMVAYSRASTELVTRAWQLLENVAGKQGLRIWELQNLIVPTCGMSTSEPWPFDYGSQRFGIRLDTDLAVVLVSESRRILRTLPTPSQADDAAKVSAAKAKFDRVLADLEDTLPTQMIRLENALVEQLRWGAAHWKNFVLRHPVLVHLAQRLLWGVYTPSGRCVGSFRVGDDGNLSDSNDMPYELAEEGSVGVLHPLDITLAEREAWGRVLADYELPTLFPQMDRPVFSFPPEERKATQIEREIRRDATWSRSHLISRGWDLDGDRDLHRTFRTADIRVELRVIENQGQLVEVTARFRRFLGYPQHHFELRDVPKVVLSEVFLELESLVNG